MKIPICKQACILIGINKTGRLEGPIYLINQSINRFFVPTEFSARNK